MARTADREDELSFSREYVSSPRVIYIRNDWPEFTRMIDKGLASMTSEEKVAIRGKYLSVRYEHAIKASDVYRWGAGISVAALAIVGLDKEGQVTYFNPAAEEITGYTKGELHGLNWFDLIVPEDP